MPKEVQSFLEINHHNLRVLQQVVTVTGDKTLRKRVEFSEEYHVPLLMKFEVQGSNKDVIEFKNKVGHFSMKIMNEKKYNHIELNNEVTKRKDNGFF